MAELGLEGRHELASLGKQGASRCVGLWCLPEFHLTVEEEQWTPTAASITRA